VCTYIYVYVCVYGYGNIRIYTYMCIYIYNFIHIYIYIQEFNSDILLFGPFGTNEQQHICTGIINLCRDAYMRCIHIYMHLFICIVIYKYTLMYKKYTYLDTCTYICEYIHILTHKHIYIHIYRSGIGIAFNFQ
jgi:hypothetical protein